MEKVFLILALFEVTLTIKAQTVNTQYGPVTGHMNGSVYEFLGIPYAAPPIDTLRWKPTLAHNNWTIPIVADSFPPKCPQKRYELGQPDSVFTLEGNEDCLYLNVWSPSISGNYPVMVFIHGGGNQQGSTGQITAGTEIYHGKNLSERGDVVAVTIQYRLGALGYLVHPGLEIENPQNISGNYAVMDQIFALQWVQSNISAFGGNPSNVTIFGESGGGVNVGNLLTIPQANGLFHRAIIESATPVINNYDTARVEGIDFVNEFISSGTDSAKIAFMRQVTADSISIKNSNPLEGGMVQMAWQPVLDNNIFVGYPVDIFQSGNFNHVPLIIGTNADEMLPFCPPTVYPFMVNGLINLMVPPVLQPTAHSLYPASTNQEAKESYAGILTDVQFTVNTRRTAQCVSLNQTEPIFRYFFSHTHNPSIPLLGDGKAYHGIELLYVFNTWENSPYAIGPWFTPQDDSVQSISLTYWTNFAYTGNPNDGLLPQWPIYDASTDPYLEIKATPNGNLFGLRTDKCNLWDSVAGFTGCSSIFGIADLPIENSTIVLYPNPTNVILHLKSNNNSENINVSIFNLLGEKVLTIVNRNYLDLKSLTPGIYFVRIQINKRIETHKIIKIE